MPKNQAWSTLFVRRPQRALTSKAGRSVIAVCTCSRWSTKISREQGVPLRGTHSRSTRAAQVRTAFVEHRQQASLHSQLSVDRRALTDAPMIQHLPEERMQLSAPRCPAIVSGWRRLRSTTLRTCSDSPSNADPIRATTYCRSWWQLRTAEKSTRTTCSRWCSTHSSAAPTRQPCRPAATWKRSHRSLTIGKSCEINPAAPETAQTDSAVAKSRAIVHTVSAPTPVRS